MNKLVLINLDILNSESIYRATINELIIYIGVYTWIG